MKIVVLLCDTVCYDYLGFNGNSVIQTPELDELASHSTSFHKYYTGSYPTIPNREDSFTGKYSFPHRSWKPLPPGTVTMADLFTGHGYTTQLIADTPHLMRFGYNYNQGFQAYQWIRGNECDVEFTRYNDPPSRTMPYEKTRMDQFYFEAPLVDVGIWLMKEHHWEEDWFVAQTAKSTSKWIEMNYKAEDFLLWVDCFECHEPWYPPRYLSDKYQPGYKGDQIYYPIYGYIDDVYSEKELKNMRAHYMGELALVSKWFGHILKKLKDVGIYDDTLIIFTTDHGTYLGERNRAGKSWLKRLDPKKKEAVMDTETREDPTPWIPWPQYDEVNHIPLTVKMPSQSSGAVSDELIQPVDLMPTLLDLAGITTTTGFDGISFAPLLTNEGSFQARELAFSSQDLKTENPNNWATVTSKQWSLNIGGNEADIPELFNLKDDPGQTRNIFESEKEIGREIGKGFIDFLTSVKADPEKIALIASKLK